VRTLPLVFTPTPYPLLARDNAEIALLAVQLLPSEVVLYLRALVEDAQGEEEAYGRALEDWGAGGRQDPLPDDPGERRFRQVSFSVSDDARGSYTLRKATVGGSGRFFNAEWYFAGDVPEEASYLVVTATDEAGEHGSVRLAL